MLFVLIVSANVIALSAMMIESGLKLIEIKGLTKLIIISVVVKSTLIQQYPSSRYIQLPLE